MKKEAGSQHEVAQDLHHRAQGLEEQEVRDRQEPQAPVPRVAEHVAVSPQRLPESPMPPIALPAQALHGRRDLGPADRIGCEEDPVLTAGLPIVLVQPDHQLHVLCHGVRPEPAHLHHRCSPEQPESTRDDEQRVEVAPASPAGEEAAGVLHHSIPPRLAVLLGRPQIVDDAEAERLLEIEETAFHHQLDRFGLADQT